MKKHCINHEQNEKACRECFDLQIEPNVIDKEYCILFSEKREGYLAGIARLDDYFKSKDCDILEFSEMISFHNGSDITLEEWIERAKEVINTPNFNFYNRILAQKMK